MKNQPQLPADLSKLSQYPNGGKLITRTTKTETKTETTESEQVFTPGEDGKTRNQIAIIRVVGQFFVSLAGVFTKRGPGNSKV